MATNIGKVGIVAKGVWNNSATYEVLDAVGYNGGTYIAKQNVPANTVPTNTTYWQPALVDDIESYDLSGISLIYESAGATNPTYTVNAVSSLVRRGTTVSMLLRLNISAKGSGNTLKITGLPVVPYQSRTIITAEGAALGAVSSGFIDKSSASIVFHTGSGANLNSTDLSTGDMLIGAVFVI